MHKVNLMQFLSARAHSCNLWTISVNLDIWHAKIHLVLMKRPIRLVKNVQPCISAEQLETIALILGETNTGFTGAEVGQTLLKCGIEDVDPTNTKWKRLYNALANSQNFTKRGNEVVCFIHRAMSPVKFVGNTRRFDSLRAGLNEALAFFGLELHEDGILHKTAVARTLPDAEKRADELRHALTDRSVHLDVLLFCRAELLEKNYFHAVLEASKSVADKIRKATGLTSDGAELATSAFALSSHNRPRLAINSLKTETEQSEQKGFMNLLIGLFGTFRNPTAHGVRIYWPIDQQDALDILSMISLVHRKLDKSIVD